MEFTIFANSPSGAKHTFAVSSNSTLADFRRALVEVVGPTPAGYKDSFRLHSHDGVEEHDVLLDSSTANLIDAGISDESTITILRQGNSRTFLCVFIYAAPPIWLIKSARLMFYLHVTERTEARCPCCYVAYGSNEDAACRIPCCGHLLCKSCSLTECWYCDTKSDDADTLSTRPGPDYAVAIYLRYEPTSLPVTTYYYCETCAVLLFTSAEKMLHSKLNGHVFTIRIGGDEAASALKGQFPKDAESLRESIRHRQKTLARLRAGIDAAPEYELAAQEAVGACVDMTCDEKDRLVAECQYVSASLVLSAREQERRLDGSIRETQLVLNMIAAALDSSDATWIISVALSVAATKKVAEVRTYPVTTCCIEFVPECADDDGMASTGRIISSDVDHSGTTLQDISDTAKDGLTYVCGDDASSFCSSTGHATLRCCRSDGSPADVYEEDISFTSDVMESIEETETSTEDISIGGAGSGSSSSADVSFVSKQAEVIFEVSKVSTGVFNVEYRLYGHYDDKSPKTYDVILRARVLGVLVVNRPIRFSVDRCRITKKVRFLNI